MIGYSTLASLPRLREYTSHRISSYDTMGGNEDAFQIKGGEKRALAEIDGPCCIKHIWMTLGVPKDDYLRRIVLRFFWDDCPEPSVECPIGDFFGMGHGLRRNFVSLPLQMSPQDGKGFNSWWPMPFKKKVIIEVENQGVEAYEHYFYIDYERYESTDAVEGLAYFHVQWRREMDTNGWAYRERLSSEKYRADPRWFNTDGKENYVMLEAEGDGIFCGAHNAIDTWKGLRKKMGKQAADLGAAAMSAITVALGADFVLYGPIEHANYMFPAIAAVEAAYSQLFMEQGKFPSQNHPIFKIA